MVSQNIDYLRENGPSTYDELPGDISTHDRMNGVWKISFTVSTNSGGGGTDGCGSLGGAKTIYYLKGEHDPVEVMERWAEENEHVIEAKTRHGLREILRRQGSEFHDAIDEVLPAQGAPGDQ